MSNKEKILDGIGVNNRHKYKLMFIDGLPTWILKTKEEQERDRLIW